MCQIPHHHEQQQAASSKPPELSPPPPSPPPLPDDCPSSMLLELAAADDLQGFIHCSMGHRSNLDLCAPWYCRQYASNKMSMLDRTPMMIAALYGNLAVLDYIVKQGADINKACGMDQATALHLAVSGGSEDAIETVDLLLRNGAEVGLVDGRGFTALDVVSKAFGVRGNDASHRLNALLTSSEARLPSLGSASEASAADLGDPWGTKASICKQDSPACEINHAAYANDAFRMYSFKIVPCSRAYSHDWTECPFAHPGENAKRRDPRKHHYSCVPCPDFRKGACAHGDLCEYAHGVFETWLHPAQYRTRMCKDVGKCNRRVCFFAHSEEELRAPVGFTDASSPMMSPAPPYLGSGPVFSSSKAMGTIPNSPSSFNSPHGALGEVSSIVGGGGHSSRLRASRNASDILFECGNLGLNCSDRDSILFESRNLAFSEGQREAPFESTGMAFDANNRDILSENARMEPTRFPFRARKSELKLGRPSGADEFFSTSLSPRSPLPMHFPLSSLHWEGLDYPKFGQNVDQNTLSMEGEGFVAQPHHSHASRLSHGNPSSTSPCSNVHTPSYYPSSEKGHFMHPYVEKRSQSLKTVEGPLAWSSNWGSPTGKLEWGVSGDDLNKFRKSMSFQGRGHHFP